MKDVRTQYEKNPYPPIPWIALPKRHQGESLRYETGAALAGSLKHRDSHRGKRILVAGCGTFEPLVVAQTHPQAAEIVAVDISQKSLDVLKKRLLLARMRNTLLPFLKGHRFPPIRLVCADLHEWQDGCFDYIVSTCMIHHVSDPPKLLKKLAGSLNEYGLLRLVTYPKKSRLQMQAVGKYFSDCGLTRETPRLVRQARCAIEELAQTDQRRLCFENQPEKHTRAGLIDAFFHACERPLSPREWRGASLACGLEWIGGSEVWVDGEETLEQKFPQWSSMPHWERLQMIDDLSLMDWNPVYWFLKS